VFATFVLLVKLILEHTHRNSTFFREKGRKSHKTTYRENLTNIKQKQSEKFEEWLFLTCFGQMILVVSSKNNHSVVWR
jgi:hypothetical protein